MWFKKKEKELIKDNIERIDKKFTITTTDGEFKIFLIGEDLYCRNIKSNDPRYGLAYMEELDIGTELVYHNPKLNQKVFVGKIKSISTH